MQAHAVRRGAGAFRAGGSVERDGPGKAFKAAPADAALEDAQRGDEAANLLRRSAELEAEQPVRSGQIAGKQLLLRIGGGAGIVDAHDLGTAFQIGGHLLPLSPWRLRRTGSVRRPRASSQA